MAINYYAPDTYKNIKLEKGMYEYSNKSFLQILEELDPTENYEGTALAGLDAFQRQLKRFNIKVNGRNADTVDKFFKSDETRLLFPEYTRRVIESGMDENALYKTIINRKIYAKNNNCEVVVIENGNEEENVIKPIEEGGEIPESNLKIKSRQVKPIKIGQSFEISREAMMGKSIDDFSFLIKEISKQFSEKLSDDAVKTIIEGDGSDNAIKTSEVTSKKLSVINIYHSMHNLPPTYNCTHILVSPKAMQAILDMPELADPKTGINLMATGNLNDMFGARIVVAPNLKDFVMLFLDKTKCLDLVIFQDVQVEHTQIQQKQTHLITVTLRYTFLKKGKESAISLNYKL